MPSILIIIILIIFFYALFSVLRKKESGDKSQSHIKYGKWIGGGLGWAFGGPIGAILGFAMGSMLDGVKVERTFYQGTARGDFAMSLLVLSAAVMKADGKVVKSELEYVRNFFLQQFGSEESQRLILILREVLHQEINIVDVSTQVGHYMDYPLRLQLLHYLFGIASADGLVDTAEEKVLEQISSGMGVDSSDFTSIRAMFVKDINSAYDILEITPNATDHEVKKAYRRLAIQYHPDKVAHLGDDIKKSATGKFQALNAAYEQIKKQRGMN